MSARKLLLVTGLVIIALFAIAQAVLTPSNYALIQTRAELQTNTVNGESSVSIDPTNSSYLIDSWPSQWFTPSYSQDGGASWHNGTASPAGSWSTGIATGDPWTAIGPDGTDYFTSYYNNTEDLVAYMATSTDHGKNWNLDLNYFASAANNSATRWTLMNGTATTACYTPDLHFVGDQQKIAVDSGTSSPSRGYVYIIGDFGVLENGSCTIHDGFTRSRDKGQTWDLHITTNPTPLASETEQIAIGQNGEIYLARFYDDSRIIFEKSTDAGASWNYLLIPVSNLEGYSVNLTITPSGILYIVYMRCLTTCNPSTNGTSAVYLISSTDDGRNWSAPSQISDPTSLPYWTYVPVVCGILTDCEPEHRPPTITASSLGIIVAWTDWRNSNNNTNADIYAYIRGTSSNTRITSYTGRLCNLSKTIACTWNGNDFMSSASSERGVYLAYGIDVDKKAPTRGDLIDATMVLIIGTTSGCTLTVTSTPENVLPCLLPPPFAATIAGITAIATLVVLVKGRSRKPENIESVIQSRRASQ